MRFRALCISLLGIVASVAACTTFDDLQADPNEVGSSSGGGGTCRNPPCVLGPNGEVLGGGKGAECTTGADCASTICEATKCTEPTSLDGVLNGSETDVDCGGTVPTNAPKCLENKKCKVAEDCLWGACDNGLCSGDKVGTKDGDQTDIDCGGVHSPACDWDRTCQFDRDCAGGHCGPDKKCLVGPSCGTTHGGTTCGTGEFGDADKQHESCCKTLLVPGFTDSRQPNKKVYLDKYEITAGRMRTFLEQVAKADPDGVPNVKAWITKNTPARWNPSWTEMLPEGWEQGTLTYNTATPTQNMSYPGQDQMAVNVPDTPQFKIRDGQWTISTGANFELGPFHFFPEYIQPGGADPDYGGSHNLNCTTEDGAFGFSTFWFDVATFQALAGAGQKGKAYPKDVMDEKALNCTPMGLLAALCAWDGGQLMTDEVFDFVAGGPWPVNPVPNATTGANPVMPPRMAGTNTANCQGGNITSDSTQTCDALYAFPDPGTGGTFDGSSRVAAPGRIAADAIAINAGDEPWMDLKGNLTEGVFRADGRFHFRGLGLGYASTQAHRTQQTTPRMKTASMGARCMRFRDTEFKPPTK